MLFLFWVPGATCGAQELEPRAYSPNPIGLNFFGIGFVRTSGGVLVDPSLPVSNVDARLNSAVLGYGRTFSVFHRSASAAVAVPYVEGEVAGDVGENRREVQRSGFADPRLRLTVNLIGDEALTPAQFAVRKPATSLGATIVVVPPLGEYDSSKLVNLGANRWAVKLELGLSHPHGPWHLETYGGVWMFTENERFLGVGRKQDPISTVQAHVSYTFRPRLWLAANATYYRGGETTVDGRGNADLQSNTRIGLTLSLPIRGRQSTKITWSDGVATRIGGDFTIIGVAWQYTWFD
ncbi:MAG TPA: transporter [Steroidobacter sp.]|nr:transporter [Steroidobacter sp.]